MVSGSNPRATPNKKEKNRARAGGQVCFLLAG